MSFDWLFAPAEWADGQLENVLAGSPLFVAVLLAAALGLRHAADPDHLIAVTSLVATRAGTVRDAAVLGAYWGLGHTTTLIAIGLPLIALDRGLPRGVERTAEQAVGLVIVALGTLALFRWMRGFVRLRWHRHGRQLGHRHVTHGPHEHSGGRSQVSSFAIGMLHGLAGTGAVVLVLVAALDSRGEAAVALAVFAPMSIASMAGCSAGWAAITLRAGQTRSLHAFAAPALGLLSVSFGLWYAGLG